MALKVVKGVAVAATDRNMSIKNNLLTHQSGGSRIRLIWTVAGIASLAAALPLTAAVLPEDRFDALFHYYNGGGLTVEGPSLQVRKQVGNNTALGASFYIDSITSASIDVVTSASKYTEKREEHSVSATYLHDKSTLNLSYTNSEESDFIAKSAHFTISQDMLGDLTTLYMGYSKGWDDVYKTLKTAGNIARDPDFSADAKRQNFRLGITQVISKELVANLNYELITDKGYLNNPYRIVHFTDGSTLPERYPNTRSSNAIALRANYYLSYRAVLHGSYRLYTDTWGVNANTFDIGYTHPYRENWILKGHYRVYSQNRASFYQDLFDPYAPQNYMARDKELSSFNSQTLGLGISYNFIQQGWMFADKGALNLDVDHMQYNYDDFSDLRNSSPSPYHFSTNVIRLYMSLWF